MKYMEEGIAYEIWKMESYHIPGRGWWKTFGIDVGGKCVYTRDII